MNLTRCLRLRRTKDFVNHRHFDQWIDEQGEQIAGCSIFPHAICLGRTTHELYVANDNVVLVGYVVAPASRVLERACAAGRSRLSRKGLKASLWSTTGRVGGAVCAARRLLICKGDGHGEPFCWIAL